MSEAILEADHLRMTYGGRVAVRDLSIKLHPGEILGFLGPNGAGKTTAIRMLTTILDPTDGTYSVGGFPADQPESIRGRIGVLPESHGFPPHLTALEYLRYQGRLYGLTPAAANAKAILLLEEVGLASRQRSLISTYSRGMRQRLGIARALVNDPLVVFLDEPTLGLDPKGQKELTKLIQWIAHEKKAGIIVCSHLLDEVEAMCDSVVILRDGEVIAHGPVGDVVNRTQKATLRIRVAAQHLSKAVPLLRAGLPAATIQAGARDDGWIHIEPGAGKTDVGATNLAALKALVAAGIPVLGLDAGGGRLQEAFLALTEASP
jgi:ABC-2 type transport system ATP-binding protein